MDDANVLSAPAQPAAALAVVDLHRRALDRLHHAVMIVGLDYKILYANNAMCQYIGLVTRQFWTAADLIGRDVMTFHPDQAVPGSERRFREMNAEGFLKPRTNPIEDLLFLTWDSRIQDEQGRLVAFVLEKVPATFNPDPLPERYCSALEKIRGTMAGEHDKRTEGAAGTPGSPEQAAEPGKVAESVASTPGSPEQAAEPDKPAESVASTSGSPEQAAEPDKAAESVAGTPGSPEQTAEPDKPAPRKRFYWF